jgi:hypothetical protein
MNAMRILHGWLCVYCTSVFESTDRNLYKYMSLPVEHLRHYQTNQPLDGYYRGKWIIVA